MAQVLSSGPAGGMTPLEAHEFIRKEFPDVPGWTCWVVVHPSDERTLQSFAGEGYGPGGRVGKWSWERVPCRVHDVGFWGGRPEKPDIGFGWTGVMRIHGPVGSPFLIFSYLRADRTIGNEYLVSTGDFKMLRRFADDMYKALRRRSAPTGRILIDVTGGADILLDPKEDEPIYLPSGMKGDIERQVHSFFEDESLYKRLQVPHRRGFLFTGAPGTGKTLMIRRLVRSCHRRYRAAAAALVIRPEMNSDMLEFFFQPRDDRPTILILEEIDSITHGTRVSRAHLLGLLDGLRTTKGTLVLGTTNHPEEVDPALIHRPSRFDRVWQFPLPDENLRRDYLLKFFPHLPVDAVSALGGCTSGWSFAYLKELRITAATHAVRRGEALVTLDDLRQAHALLATQFEAGRLRAPVSTPGPGKVGFEPSAPDLQPWPEVAHSEDGK